MVADGAGLCAKFEVGMDAARMERCQWNSAEIAILIDTEECTQFDTEYLNQKQYKDFYLPTSILECSKGVTANPMFEDGTNDRSSVCSHLVVWSFGSLSGIVEWG